MSANTPIFAPLPLPAGRYAIGLSGGADSTYLTRAAAQMPGMDLRLVHINHQLRGAESQADEQFCRELAIELGLPIDVAYLSDIERTVVDLPANPSARYRAIRLHVFKYVIDAHRLDGLLLAHHANDQAETVLLRLMRGGGVHSLCGMRGQSVISHIPVRRPLLAYSADEIRTGLRNAAFPWREDSSNASPHYRRNAARQVLAQDPMLVPLLAELADHCQRAVNGLNGASPQLPTRFHCTTLMNLPAMIAEHAARRWLVQNGSPSDDISSEVCARLVEQAIDPNSSPRRHYPGKRFVRRRKKHIEPG